MVFLFQISKNIFRVWGGSSQEKAQSGQPKALALQQRTRTHTHTHKHPTHMPKLLSVAKKSSLFLLALLPFLYRFEKQKTKMNIWKESDMRTE